ncbi:MAG: glycosyltransferase family 2 protein [Bacteroidetes bacterium]|nr:glycosyltransferase family 2 protein [Bacteroidota bacterium]
MLNTLDQILLPQWVQNSWNIHTSGIITEEQLYAEIRWGLQQFDAPVPVVSIVIPAWNEERTIARTLYSLSRIRTKYPTELIVVNNNSNDNTQQILDICGVRSIQEPRQGIAQARQTGLLAAKGRYILCGDADTLYPAEWVDIMMEELQQDGVAAVWGKHSFVPAGSMHRSTFIIYEFIKQLLYRFRGIRRPYLNAMGANVGYRKEIAFRVGGYDITARRGSDGRLAMAMFAHGRITAARSRRATVWTDARRFGFDNGILHSLSRRIMKELPRMAEYAGLSKRDFKKLAGFRSDAAPLGQE